jgi:excisionase family DNA binding protein
MDEITGAKEQLKLSDLISEEELAKFFGIGRPTIANWRLNKGLPYIKVGIRSYFIEEDVVSWLRQHKIQREPTGNMPVSS